MNQNNSDKICPECSKKISSNKYYEASLEKHYHLSCLVCIVCFSQIDVEEKVGKLPNGDLICEKDYKYLFTNNFETANELNHAQEIPYVICSMCLMFCRVPENVISVPLLAEDQYYHIWHFSCFSTELNKTNLGLINNFTKIYCKTCSWNKNFCSVCHYKSSKYVSYRYESPTDSSQPNTAVSFCEFHNRCIVCNISFNINPITAKISRNNLLYCKFHFQCYASSSKCGYCNFDNSGKVEQVIIDYMTYCKNHTICHICGIFIKDLKSADIINSCLLCLSCKNKMQNVLAERNKNKKSDINELVIPQ